MKIIYDKFDIQLEGRILAFFFNNRILNILVYSYPQASVRSIKHKYRKQIKIKLWGIKITPSEFSSKI